jgi:hypothetical protein
MTYIIEYRNGSKTSIQSAMIVADNELQAREIMDTCGNLVKSIKQANESMIMEYLINKRFKYFEADAMIKAII